MAIQSSRRSELEETLAWQIKVARLPEPQREFRFLPSRRFRFDFCWLDRRIALEIDGGIWTGGRHTRGKGAMSDAEKYSLAAIEGWRILRVTGQHINNGLALRWLETILMEQRLRG